jgi:hypothetical protein
MGKKPNPQSAILNLRNSRKNSRDEERWSRAFNREPCLKNEDVEVTATTMRARTIKEKKEQEPRNTSQS